MKENIILFSSSEGLKVAKSIQRNISGHTCKLWTNNFFTISKQAIEDLTNSRDHHSYAVVVVTPDDISIIRGKKHKTPRDNIVFEMGLSLALFGTENTIIVCPEDVKLPTDTLGMTLLNYTADDNDIDATGGTISSKIERHIEKRSENSCFVSSMTWNEYMNLVSILISKLKRLDNGCAGYHFDIVVGVSRGGLLIADLIGRAFGKNFPAIYLFADRRDKNGIFDSDDCILNNKDIINILSHQSIRNILVVESMTREGITIDRAKKYLQANLPGKQIKSAVLLTDRKFGINKNIDFVAKYTETQRLRMPYNAFD